MTVFPGVTEEFERILRIISSDHKYTEIVERIEGWYPSLSAVIQGASTSPEDILTTLTNIRNGIRDIIALKSGQGEYLKSQWNFLISYIASVYGKKGRASDFLQQVRILKI